MARTALRFACALAVAVATTACGRPAPSPAPAWDRTQAEREVLFVVLRDVVATKDSSRFVLGTTWSRVETEAMRRMRRMNMPEAKACTFEDLVADQGKLLPSDLRGPAPIDWLDNAAFYALAPDLPETDPLDADYAAFWKKFPGAAGLTEFSRVGFSCDHSEALVEVGTMRGSLDGFGPLVLLHLTPSGWTVVKAVETWIS